jgi:phosphoribosylaminoimidazolecarboxamide formyltransferase/IMP cyclohydrolase
VLGRRDLESHRRAMDEHGITPIDLVCVNLYPFEQTILREGITDSEAIEQIDIGGPAMLRSAAKNHEFVTVVTTADQYDQVIGAMRANDGATTVELRRDLAAAAFMRTAEYDTAISAWMCSRRPRAFPPLLRLTYAHARDLRYGENPHQRAAVYSNPASAEPSVVSANTLHGKALSYNNLLDGSAALQIVQEFAEVFPDRTGAAIIKHTNPCGAAVAANLPDAFERAYDGDPLAAFGGILAVNQRLDDDTARRIVDGQKFLEMIIAPGYGDDALDRLRDRWKNVRILAVRGIGHTSHRKIDYRSVPGGMLVQERDLRPANARDWIHAAGPAPSEVLLADAAVIWTICKHLKSNAIAIGADGRLLGAGMGQVDRVTACRLAVERAGEKIGAEGQAIAASDAFFPFPDGPQILLDAGVRCLVHPGGSKRDAETIDLCNERDVTCMITNVRHFRH